MGGRTRLVANENPRRWPQDTEAQKQADAAQKQADAAQRRAAANAKRNQKFIADNPHPPGWRSMTKGERFEFLQNGAPNEAAIRRAILYTNGALNAKIIGTKLRAARLAGAEAVARAKGQGQERPYIRRATRVQARVSTGVGIAYSMEGPQRVNPGDLIVTDVSGAYGKQPNGRSTGRVAEYPVPNWQLKYTPTPGQPGSYDRIQDRVMARVAGPHEAPIDKNGTMIVPPPGYMIVRDLTTGRVRPVDPKVFLETYSVAKD